MEVVLDGVGLWGAKNIKYGRTELSIETIIKIVTAYPNGYNPVGE
jgi:hypothetical protein